MPPTWQYVPATAKTSTLAADNTWKSVQYTDFTLGERPQHATFGQVHIKFTSIVTAADFSWYLSSDQAGGAPITAVQTGKVWSAHKDGSNWFAGAIDAEAPFVAAGSGAFGANEPAVWLHVKLDAGTATVQSFLTYNRKGGP
jgi:hypothetical protein